MFVKLKFNDFNTTTVQQPVVRGVKAYHALCDTAWQRSKKPVRLLGLGIRFETRAPEKQITLL